MFSQFLSFLHILTKVGVHTFHRLAVVTFSNWGIYAISLCVPYYLPILLHQKWCWPLHFNKLPKCFHMWTKVWYQEKKHFVKVGWKSDHVTSRGVISCTRFLSKLWCMKSQWSLICNKGCLMPIILAEAEVCALISGCYCPLLIDTSHYGYYFALGNLHSGGHKPAFWGPLPLSLKFNLAIFSQQDWYP